MKRIMLFMMLMLGTVSAVMAQRGRCSGNGL